MEGVELGRYVLYDIIASGGMASVHFGRMRGAAGFARTVAIKRLHPHHARDPELVTMLLDEARIASRVSHPNVVPTLDVVALPSAPGREGELLLVMEYIRGDSLSALLRGAEVVPWTIVASIALGALYGLEAAHEAKTERGAPLGIVHRDVSPQNLLVGADGVTRVADFGVAKAAARAQSTRDGKIKGKLAYMAPEQIKRRAVDRRADIFAMGVVLWEALARRRLFQAEDASGVIDAVLSAPIPPLGSIDPSVPEALVAAVHRALERDPDARFPTALAMAEAIERAGPHAPQREVAAWVLEVARAKLEERDAIVAAIERAGSPPSAPAVPPHIGQLVEQSTEVHTEPRHSSNKPRALLIAGLALAVATAGGVTLWSTRRSAPAPANALAASAPSLAPSASARAIGDAAEAPSASAAAALPPRQGPSSAALPRAEGPSNPTSGAPSSRPRPPSSKPSKSCDPPFVVDSQGIERFKPGCL